MGKIIQLQLKREGDVPRSAWTVALMLLRSKPQDRRRLTKQQAKPVYGKTWRHLRAI